VDSDAAVERVRAILTVCPGPDDLLVDTGVSFTPGITAEQILEAIHRVEDRCRARVPRPTGSVPRPSP
jgi:hypothetical protein